MVEYFKNMAVATGEETATVFITGEVEEYGVVELVQDIEACKAKGVSEITFQINSPGGSVKDGLAMYDAISALTNIRTKAYITGVCASAATYPALACDTVVIAASANFMVHECFGGIAGDLNSLETGLEYFKNLREQVIAIYCSKTGLTAGEVEDIMAKARFLSAQEALELRFVDTVEGQAGEEEKPAEEPAEGEEGHEPEAAPKQEIDKPRNFWSIDTLKNFLTKHNISMILPETDDTARQEDVVNSLTAQVKDLESRLEATNKSYTELQDRLAAREADIANRIEMEVATRIASMGYAANSLPAPERERQMTPDEFKAKLKAIYTSNGLAAATQFVQDNPLYNF